MSTNQDNSAIYEECARNMAIEIIARKQLEQNDPTIHEYKNQPYSETYANFLKWIIGGLVITSLVIVILNV